MAQISKDSVPGISRRFASQREVEQFTGISVRTLQSDRQLGRERFPSYQVGRRILYDLAEIEQIIRRSRRGGEQLAEAR
jgi:predicted DNA-binding transcriptional regulator AlpA